MDEEEKLPFTDLVWETGNQETGDGQPPLGWDYEDENRESFEEEDYWDEDEPVEAEPQDLLDDAGWASLFPKEDGLSAELLAAETGMY